MKNTKEKFSNLIRLEQFRNACEAFDQTKTILDAINLIKTTIEEGHILLSEDEEAKNIDIKFNVHLGKKDYPPFVIGLPSDDPEEEEEVKKEVEVKNDNAKENDVEVLPTKFDYQGDMQAAVKYGKSTKNTTEYANPIINHREKSPIANCSYQSNNEIKNTNNEIIKNKTGNNFYENKIKKKFFNGNITSSLPRWYHKKYCITSKTSNC